MHLNKPFRIPAFFALSLCLLWNLSPAQTCRLKGSVTDSAGNPVDGATLRLVEKNLSTSSNQSGYFYFNRLSPGKWTLECSCIGYETIHRELDILSGQPNTLAIVLSMRAHTMAAITVNGVRTISGMGRLDEIHEGVIYSGKKTEVLLLDSLDANTAQNNPRQVLGRIPGSNYSETQGSGFPSNGIGLRGLNPSQSIETNTRQNGYNLAADIYGYAESYYLSPLQAVERIEVTRGESSLQFGPQFGGVINYVLKSGNPSRKFEYNMEQTGGSFGFVNSFHAMGGQLGRFNYYGFLQYQASQGQRPNSDYRQLSGFGKISWQPSGRLTLSLEYTLMRNRIHMPGGFNDAQFEANPDTSYRARNWLESPWNILAAKSVYTISPSTSLQLSLAYVFSARNLVWKNEDGGPATPDSISTATLQYVNREVQRETMNSLTLEARLLTQYSLFHMRHTLAAGVRAFSGGFGRLGGGEGTTGSDFNLALLDPRYEYALHFGTVNLAPFAENIFRLSGRLSVTPGLRFEYLHSIVKGYITDNGQVNSDLSRNRYIPLFGLGAQFRTTRSTSIYGNISQAYSPATYDQLTRFGSSSRIDPGLRDASGYNADLGWRGSFGKYLNFDADVFYLAYNNRIGIEQRTDPSGNPYTYRTNIASSASSGLETYIECRPSLLFDEKLIGKISFFNSFAYIDARYLSGPFKGNRVEYAPRTINRFGLTYCRSILSTTFVISHTAESYGDASNIPLSSDPVAGRIPGYTVMDWSATCRLPSHFQLKAGVNNLGNKRYFTKRTDEYPGPGIIPALGRSLYLSFGATF